jgi:hypothetical protein
MPSYVEQKNYAGIYAAPSVGLLAISAARGKRAKLATCSSMHI